MDCFDFMAAVTRFAPVLKVDDFTFAGEIEKAFDLVFGNDDAEL